MAYREVAMWEILQVLRRLSRGETKSAVACSTGHSRSTIRRYAATARELGWAAGTSEPSEELAAAIARRVHPGAHRDPGEIATLLAPHAEQIRAWLTPPAHEKRGLRLTKVHRLLARQGVDVPYSSLHRFAVQQCGFGERRRITVRMADSPPGELAEIDFGRLGPVPDPLCGRSRIARALLVTLPHSRHQYVHVTFSQRLPDLIDGLEDAWAFFGGVPRRVVVDNMRTAITTADRYDPIFQRTFAEYAAYRGFVIDPTPVRDPTAKPHVERGIPYFRDSCFRGEAWRDLEALQAGAITWCLTTAGTRLHGTTRQRPLAVFETVERATLLPLERPRFDPPSWAQCKVHPDHHLSIGKATYSVPTRYIGQHLWVRSDRHLVRIYADHALLKTHIRQAPGGRSTDYSDYPAHLSAYTRRDPDRLIRHARAHGAAIGRFAEELLAGTFPWAKLRQAQRLLRLGDKYGWPRVDAACARALDYELLNVKRVEHILREHLDQDARAPLCGENAPSAISARFARPATSFRHSPLPPASTPDSEPPPCPT